MSSFRGWMLNLRWLLIVLFCPLQVLAGGNVALAQAVAQAVAQETVAPLPALNPTPNTQHRPLFWANGITRADELGAYQSVGLNTVVVRLEWRPSPDGLLDTEDLEPARQFAAAAATRGLKIIYSVPAAPFDSAWRVFGLGGGSLRSDWRSY